MLVLFLITIPIIAAVFDLSFVTLYKDQGRVGASQFAAIEFWGAVGGLVGALTALQRLRARRGPYPLHVAPVDR